MEQMKFLLVSEKVKLLAEETGLEAIGNRDGRPSSGQVEGRGLKAGAEENEREEGFLAEPRVFKEESREVLGGAGGRFGPNGCGTQRVWRRLARTRFRRRFFGGVWQ